MRPSSLLELHLNGDHEKLPLQDYSTSRVFFRQLPERMCHLIRKWDYVLGCVAWLTHPDVLDALASRKGVSLVVQKEDFLRPDGPRWATDLRGRYRKIPGFERHELPGLARELSTCSDPDAQAIRCVGNHNKDRKPAHPRSHHKFLIFCKAECLDCEKLFNCGERCVGCEHRTTPPLVPELVWTGSFNPTSNGGQSFENAVVLDDSASCSAYLNEWAQIFALSEPLDWDSPWCEPQWRIGS